MSKIANIPSNNAIIFSDGRYKTPKHIILLEKEMLEIASGINKRLVVTMPPRHGKSEYIARYYPAWYLLNFPNKRVIVVSYAASFAETHTIQARSIYTYFRNDLIIRRNNYWQNQDGGSYHSIGAGGDLMGRGADLIIIDDPYKDFMAANSNTQRNNIWNWFVSSVITRVQKHTAIVLIQTRWHKDDLAGRLKNDYFDEWKFLDLPALAKENDPCGRALNEPLWNSEFNIDFLLKQKELLGDYFFSALYQQNPISSTNQIIQNEWVAYYDVLPPGGVIFQSWDTAFEKTDNSDYSVCTTWKYLNNNLYLLNTIKEKLTYPDLVQVAKELNNEYQPSTIIIENRGSGISLKQDLLEIGLPIIPVTPTSNKILRLNSVSYLFRQNRVFFPKNIRIDLLGELFDFPYTAHDDFVDSLSQALDYSKTLSNLDNIFNYIPKKQKTNYYKV